MFEAITIISIVITFIVYNTIVIVPMRESYVVERLGKFKSVLNTGFHFLVPFFDRIAYRHEIREEVLDIPSQSCTDQFVRRKNKLILHISIKTL